VAESGWYADPESAERLRYWNGHSWGDSKPRYHKKSTGERLQASGNRIADFGKNMLWLTVGVFFLAFLGLLIFLV
jgi:hypothetical protein